MVHEGLYTSITPHHLLSTTACTPCHLTHLTFHIRNHPHTSFCDLAQDEPSMLLDMFHLHKRASKNPHRYLSDIEHMDACPLDFLNSLRCTKLPPTLWRVQHADSQASFDEGCDLVAKLSDRVPKSLYELRAALSRHLKWGYSRADSYFISIFEDYCEALEWAKARKRSAGDDEKIAIYRIRTSAMGPNALIFRVDRMMSRLEVEVDGRREGEFVILNRVSARAMSLFKDHVELEPEAPTALRLEAFAREGSRLTPFDRCMKRRSYVYNAARLSSTDALFASYLARVDVEQKRMGSIDCESLLDAIGVDDDERYSKGGEREEQDRVDSLISVIESDRDFEKMKWKPLPMRPKSKLIQAVEADLGVDVGDG